MKGSFSVPPYVAKEDVKFKVKEVENTKGKWIRFEDFKKFVEELKRKRLREA